MSPAGAQRGLLRALSEASVGFVVVGGHAVSAHGLERATRDVDIVYSTAKQSCERLARALADLRAEVMYADGPVPEGGVSADWLAFGGHFRFATERGPLDAFSTVSGFDYERLASLAVDARIDDIELSICGYEDLIAMKSATERPIDAEDVRRLEQLRKS